MEFKEALGVAVQALRRQRGLTQKDMLGTISTQYLSDIECGKRAPSVVVLSRICERLGAHEVLPIILAKHFMSPGVELAQELKNIERQLRDFGFLPGASLPK
ncbi:helix-turn-helix domain-containing protein [Pseudomonas sp. UMAB-40]|uniref:helix-turn-helix domain-containing protein n=1 Tax=Pseudomonas sp. UMAB-40 TaxID=1365407 RepID=UPI001C590BC8|nr:helix-turn-helix transcriptional regulator [Pseudomonas sp. UMAB-40]